MQIAELLSEGRVIPALQGKTKTCVLRELVEPVAAHDPAIAADRVFEVLLERERLGSTGVAPGVAIPHARLPGLSNVFAVVGRHPHGVDFASLDGAPTNLFFLLLAPEDAVGQLLKALAQAARWAKDAALRERLMSAGDRHDLYLRLLQYAGS